MLRGRRHSCHLAALFGLYLFHVVAIAGTVPEIATHAGSRIVPKYVPQATLPLPEPCGSVQYGYLLVTDIPTKAERTQVEAETGIRFLGIYTVQGGVFVYKVSYRTSLSFARQSLHSAVPGFHNLEPEAMEDKVTPAIIEGRGFDPAAVDTASGDIFASVVFRADATREARVSLLQTYADSVLDRTGRRYTILSPANTLRAMASNAAVEYMNEQDPNPAPLLALTRQLIEVDSAQGFDIGSVSFPPCDTTVWATNNRLTGKGIWAGIYDTGIDSLILDFTRIDTASGGDTATRRCRADSLTWSYPTSGDDQYHGTFVAGIVGGNGWMSDPGGGSDKYRWRGIAPEVDFVSRSIYTYDGDEADVNNHSSVCGGVWERDFYGTACRDVDEELYQHEGKTPASNIMVYAIGNSGKFPGNGSDQVGYYSMLSNPKNAIKVGNAEKQSGKWHYGCSMGPTRDGRIGPEVIAPGATDGVAERWNLELDYWGILDDTGGVKVEWNFDGTTEDMFISRYSLDSSDTSILLDVNHAHRVITREVLSPTIVSGADDTLVIRMRGGDTATPASDVWCKGEERIIDVNLFWQLNADATSDTTNLDAWSNQKYVYAYLSINDTAGDGWNEIRAPLSKLHQMNGANTIVDDQVWTTGDTIKRLGLQWTGSQTLTPNRFVNVYDAYYDYIDGGGSSASAPHVAGIVVLMLQEYKDKYLDGIGQNIHDNAFWNSTAKAILAQTATDVIQETPRGGTNPDLGNIAAFYHAGPDYATGYGLVNARKAIEHVDTMLFKEDSVEHGETVAYTFNVAASTDTLRITLAWDDPPDGVTTEATAYFSKLINNLDLWLLPPEGQWGIHRPWILDSLPHGEDIPGDGIDPIDSADVRPADTGIDNRNNLELVEVVNPQSGTWTAVIRGTRVPWGPQHFSIVSDDTLTKVSYHSPVEFTTVGPVTDSSGSWDASYEQYTLCGASGLVWGVKDTFSFSYRYLTGDFQASAKVVSLTNTDGNAKAGLMARAALDDNAIHGHMFVYHTSGAAYQYRTTEGGSTNSTGRPGYSPGSTWLKIRRIGSTLYGFVSDDGVDYDLVSYSTVGSGGVYVGLTHASSNGGASSGCAVFDEICIEPQASPYGEWQYQRRVYLNTTSTGADVSSDLQDFPVLVRLDSTNFDFTRADPDGADVRFAKYETPLCYEIEEWDNTAKRAAVWVKVPLVEGDEDDQFITMYYDNEVASSESDGEAVFDTSNDYESVWHLHDDFNDATAAQNDATNDGTTDTGAYIADGQYYDGSDDLMNSNYRTHPSQATYSAWIKWDGGGGSFPRFFEKDPLNTCFINNKPSSGPVGAIRFHQDFTTTGGHWWTDSTLSSGAWYYITIRYDNSSQANTPQTYFNAEYASINESKSTSPSGTAITGDSSYILFNREDKARPFDGIVDEIRISSTLRSLDWITLCYENQKVSQTLVEFREDYGEWKYSTNLYLNTTASGANVADTILDFPVLVRLDATNFTFAQARSSGEDIRFAKVDGTVLPYEIERWDETNELAEVWVKVDSVHGSDSTVITMYWGKGDALDASDPEGVFETSNGFTGVWHLNQSFADATANDHDATNDGTLDTAAMVANGRWYDDTDDAIVSNCDDQLQQRTWSTWLRWEGYSGSTDYNRLFEKDGQENLFINTNSSSGPVGAVRMWANFSNNGSWWWTSTTLSTDTWYHFAMTYDDLDTANTATYYIDGLLDSLNTSKTTIPSGTRVYSDSSYVIGNRTDRARPFNGTKDEVRLSSVLRSAGWIKLCYENQRASQTLVEFE